MKQLRSGALLITTLMAPMAGLAEQHRFFDYAKVKNVDPVYRTVEHRVPRESCWVETVRTENHHRGRGSATSTLVGGIIGGAIGHAVGRGSDNKKIGAVVGSALGMSVGHDVGKKQRRSAYHDVRYDDVERCEVSYTRETEEKLTGYEVTYKYRGETYTTFMDEHPGDRIKVSVSMRPVRHRYD